MKTIHIRLLSEPLIRLFVLHNHSLSFIPSLLCDQHNILIILPSSVYRSLHLTSIHLLLFLFPHSSHPPSHPSSPTSFPPSTCPPVLPQLLHHGEHGRLLNIHHSVQIKQPAMPANDHYYSLRCQRQNLNLVQLAEGGEVKKAREGDREVGCRPVCLH